MRTAHKGSALDGEVIPAIINAVNTQPALLEALDAIVFDFNEYGVPETESEDEYGEDSAIGRAIAAIAAAKGEN